MAGKVIQTGDSVAKQKKKRSSKNLKINTRIVLSSALTILIPVFIIALFSTVFLGFSASYFNLSSVTTNEYGTINQIQWNQTLSSISDELLSADSDEKKLKKIGEFIAPLEQWQSIIHIECNNQTFYSTEDKDTVLKKASSITSIDIQKNIFYYGENGLVIITHVHDASNHYLIMVVNAEYTVNDISERYSTDTLSSLLAGRTGLIALVIILLFVIAIIILSFITSRTIVRPIQKIARGADEIAGGNLDYEIDYKSTNELGKTVDSFNAMRLRLKEMIESRARSEQAKKEMTAGFAHDLRTPLTSIKGYVEGLRDGIANTPEKQQYYLQTIYESTLQTEKLLNELMTFSKLELGSTENNRSIVNVNEFVADGQAELTHYLKQQNFALEVKNSCTDTAEIEIDTDAFQRVFLNIISNSIKYKRPEVPGKVTLIVTEYDKMVIMEFADNGIGVAKENLNKIFDAMYRTDPARSQVSQGSGLGLAVCKQIVEQNGGSIWARSHEDNGLSIFISLMKRADKKDEKNTDY